MGHFAEAIASGKFLVTAEINPPKGVDLTRPLADAALLKPYVDAANVTDQTASVMRMSPLGLCVHLKRLGIDPILQVTCRDRNRIALQADLLAAAALGIENVLCLTGDPVSTGDHPDAKPVFDVKDGILLLEAASTLMQGKDLSGNALQGAPSFLLGAVANPGAQPVDVEVQRTEAKAKKGARFFQTQAVFEPEAVVRFMDRVRHLGVPVLAGIILLKSGAMARHLNQSVPGIRIPDRLIEEMDAAADKGARSVEIAARTIAAVRPYCQGVHIMAIGWERRIPEVLESAGLLPTGARP